MGKSKTKNSFSVLMRATALVICVFMLAGEGALYAGTPRPELIQTQALPLSIPEQFGTLDETYHAQVKPRVAKHKTIIYIQDAHDSLEAQENIAKMIQHLVGRAGIQTVFEEGDEGEVSYDELFSSVPEAKIKAKASYFLMDKLRINGAEFAHINRTKDFKLVGADSLNLYLANLDWYKSAAREQKEIESNIQWMVREVNLLAQKFLSREAKEFLKLKKRYDADELDLLEYVRRLTSLRGTAEGCDLPDGKAGVAIHATTQQTEIAADTSCPRNDGKNLYPSLETILTADESTDVSTINPKQIFSELNQLGEDVGTLLFTESRDHQIAEYLEALELFSRLNKIEITAEEYEAVRVRVTSLKTQNVAEFIAKHSEKSVVLPKSWESLIESSIKFYEYAHRRDSAIAGALDEHLAGDEKVAVLVFGGFHKEGIKEILKEQGYSYHIVTPKITEVSERHQQYYKKLMAEGFHDYELSEMVAKAASQLRLLPAVKTSRIRNAKQSLDFVAEALRASPTDSYNFVKTPKKLEDAWRRGQQLATTKRSEARKLAEDVVPGINSRDNFELLQAMSRIEDFENKDLLNRLENIAYRDKRLQIQQYAIDRLARFTQKDQLHKLLQDAFAEARTGFHMLQSTTFASRASGAAVIPILIRLTHLLRDSDTNTQAMQQIANILVERGNFTLSQAPTYFSEFKEMVERSRGHNVLNQLLSAITRDITKYTKDPWGRYAVTQRNAAYRSVRNGLYPLFSDDIITMEDYHKFIHSLPDSKARGQAVSLLGPALSNISRTPALRQQRETIESTLLHLISNDEGYLENGAPAEDEDVHLYRPRYLNPDYKTWQTPSGFKFALFDGYIRSVPYHASRLMNGVKEGARVLSFLPDHRDGRVAGKMKASHVLDSLFFIRYYEEQVAGLNSFVVGNVQSDPYPRLSKKEPYFAELYKRFPYVARLALEWLATTQEDVDQLVFPTAETIVERWTDPGYDSLPKEIAIQIYDARMRAMGFERVTLDFEWEKGIKGAREWWVKKREHFDPNLADLFLAKQPEQIGQLADHVAERMQVEPARDDQAPDPDAADYEFQTLSSLRLEDEKKVQQFEELLHYRFLFNTVPDVLIRFQSFDRGNADALVLSVADEPVGLLPYVFDEPRKKVIFTEGYYLHPKYKRILGHLEFLELVMHLNEAGFESLTILPSFVPSQQSYYEPFASMQGLEVSRDARGRVHKIQVDVSGQNDLAVSDLKPIGQNLERSEARDSADKDQSKQEGPEFVDLSRWLKVPGAKDQENQGDGPQQGGQASQRESRSESRDDEFGGDEPIDPNEVRAELEQTQVYLNSAREQTKLLRQQLMPWIIAGSAFVLTFAIISMFGLFVVVAQRRNFLDLFLYSVGAAFMNLLVKSAFKSWLRLNPVSQKLFQAKRQVAELEEHEAKLLKQLDTLSRSESRGDEFSGDEGAFEDRLAVVRDGLTEVEDAGLDNFDSKAARLQWLLDQLWKAGLPEGTNYHFFKTQLQQYQIRLDALRQVHYEINPHKFPKLFIISGLLGVLATRLLPIHPILGFLTGGIFGVLTLRAAEKYTQAVDKHTPLDAERDIDSQRSEARDESELQDSIANVDQLLKEARRERNIARTNFFSKLAIYMMGLTGMLGIYTLGIVFAIQNGIRNQVLNFTVVTTGLFAVVFMYFQNLIAKDPDRARSILLSEQIQSLQIQKHKFTQELKALPLENQATETDQRSEARALETLRTQVAEEITSYEMTDINNLILFVERAAASVEIPIVVDKKQSMLETHRLQRKIRVEAFVNFVEAVKEKDSNQVYKLGKYLFKLYFEDLYFGLSFPNIYPEFSKTGDLERIHFVKRYRFIFPGFYLTAPLTAIVYLTLLGGFTWQWTFYFSVLGYGAFWVMRLATQFEIGYREGHEYSHAYQYVLIERIRRAAYPHISAKQFYERLPEAVAEPVLLRPIIKIPPSVSQLESLAELTFEGIEEAHGKPARSESRVGKSMKFHVEVFRNMTEEQQKDPRMVELVQTWAEPPDWLTGGAGNAFVAYQDERPVGLIAFGDHPRTNVPVVVDDGLFVHPDFRGNGLAGKLVNSLIRSLKINGYAFYVVAIKNTDEAKRFWANFIEGKEGVRKSDEAVDDEESLLIFNLKQYEMPEKESALQTRSESREGPEFVDLQRWVEILRENKKLTKREMSILRYFHNSARDMSVTKVAGVSVGYAQQIYNRVIERLATEKDIQQILAGAPQKYLISAEGLDKLKQLVGDYGTPSAKKSLGMIVQSQSDALARSRKAGNAADNVRHPPRNQRSEARDESGDGKFEFTRRAGLQGFLGAFFPAKAAQKAISSMSPKGLEAFVELAHLYASWGVDGFKFDEKHGKTPERIAELKGILEPEISGGKLPEELKLFLDQQTNQFKYAMAAFHEREVEREGYSVSDNQETLKRREAEQLQAIQIALDQPENLPLWNLIGKVMNLEGVSASGLHSVFTGNSVWLSDLFAEAKAIGLDSDTFLEYYVDQHIMKRARGEALEEAQKLRRFGLRASFKGPLATYRDELLQDFKRALEKGDWRLSVQNPHIISSRIRDRKVREAQEKVAEEVERQIRSQFGRDAKMEYVNFYGDEDPKVWAARYLEESTAASIRNRAWVVVRKHLNGLKGETPIAKKEFEHELGLIEKMDPEKVEESDWDAYLSKLKTKYKGRETRRKNKLLREQAEQNPVRKESPLPRPKTFTTDSDLTVETLQKYLDWIRGTSLMNFIVAQEDVGQVSVQTLTHSSFELDQYEIGAVTDERVLTITVYEKEEADKKEVFSRQFSNAHELARFLSQEFNPYVGFAGEAVKETAAKSQVFATVHPDQAEDKNAEHLGIGFMVEEMPEPIVIAGATNYADAAKVARIIALLLIYHSSIAYSLPEAEPKTLEGLDGEAPEKKRSEVRKTSDKIYADSSKVIETNEVTKNRRLARGRVISRPSGESLGRTPSQGEGLNEPKANPSPGDGVRSEFELNKKAVFVITADELEALTYDQSADQDQFRELLGIKRLNEKNLHVVILGDTSSLSQRAWDLKTQFKNVHFGWTRAISTRDATIVHFGKTVNWNLFGETLTKELKAKIVSFNIFDGVFLAGLSFANDDRDISVEAKKKQAIESSIGMLTRLFQAYAIVAQSA